MRNFKLWLETRIQPMIFCDLDDTLVTTYNDAYLIQLRRQVERSKNNPRFANLTPKYQAQLEVFEKAPLVRLPTENRIAIERPGCKEFVQALSSIGPLFLLSAGTQDYIQKTIDVLGLSSYFDGIHSVRNGPPPPHPSNDNWVLIDDVISADKLAALGLDLKYDQWGDPDRDNINKKAEKHIIRIKPFVGDVTEPPGEFSRVLTAVRSRLGYANA